MMDFDVKTGLPVSSKMSQFSITIDKTLEDNNMKPYSSKNEVEIAYGNFDLMELDMDEYREIMVPMKQSPHNKDFIVNDKTTYLSIEVRGVTFE